MHVFVLTASWISEHTLMTETVGVYAHMHQTTGRSQMLRAEGKHVLVTKHTVVGLPEPSTTVLRLGKPVPAFPTPVGEGVQTDPPLTARCHGSGWRDGTCTHGDRAGVR